MGFSQVLAVGISFVLLPFIVSYIGKELYGVYILAIALNGYFSLFDFGIGMTITKYVAEYTGREDIKGLNNILSASFTFYILFGILASVLIYLFAYNFEHFFKVDDINNKETIKNVFLITAFFSLWMWPTRLFQGTIEGLQRFDLKAKVNMLIQLCYAGLTYILLTSGYGIISLILLTHSLAVLGNLLLWALCYKHFRHLKISFPYINRETYKLIFSFSFYIFLSTMTGFIIYESSNLIIGSFVSLAAVTLYQPAYMFQKGLATVINTVIGGSFGAASAELEGKGDFEKQRHLFLEGTRYIALAMVPMIIITIFFLQPFILYWLGKGFIESILPAQLIIACWVFNGILNVGSGILIAKNMVRNIFRAMFLEAVINLIISLILIKKMGIVAIAIGAIVARVLVYSPLILSCIFKTLNISPIVYIKSFLQWNYLSFALAPLLSWMTLTLIYPADIVITFIEMGCIYTFIIAVYYFFRMTQKDRENIRSLTGI